MENIKILLVDDDADDQDFFRYALLDSRLGAQLTAVTDGQQCIDYLLTAPLALIPDIIFLDINMPGLDGKACLREIRLQERSLLIPVIMLTTSHHLKDIEETYRDGANRYISKMLFYMDGARWLLDLLSSDWQEKLTNPSREKFASID